jgi:hypothetical protein
MAGEELWAIPCKLVNSFNFEIQRMSTYDELEGSPRDFPFLSQSSEFDVIRHTYY